MSLIRFLIFLVLGYIGYRVLRRFISGTGRIPESRKDGVIDDMVQDPVCGTYIPRKSAYGVRTSPDGKESFFCSRECIQTYDEKTSRESTGT